MHNDFNPATRVNFRQVQSLARASQLCKGATDSD
jgi:hypothetical protein